jgi:hypothetical protein
MDNNIDLSKGDFVYQSDQELFLVVIGEDEESYQFAVHGWRNIGKNRLDEYISHDNGKLHKQDSVTEIVESKGDDTQRQSFEQMREMRSVYADIDLEEDGPHTDFALEDS